MDHTLSSSAASWKGSRNRAYGNNVLNLLKLHFCAPMMVAESAAVRRIHWLEATSSSDRFTTLGSDSDSGCWWHISLLDTQQASIIYLSAQLFPRPTSPICGGSVSSNSKSSGFSGETSVEQTAKRFLSNKGFFCIVEKRYFECFTIDIQYIIYSMIVTGCGNRLK